MSITGQWIELIFKVATGSWKTRLIIAPVVAVLFLSVILIFIVLSFQLDKSLGVRQTVFQPWGVAAGTALIIFGFALMALSVACFVRARGTPVPFSPPPVLVASGPYRYVRNPMLTGIFVLLFGVGIALGSLSLVFIFMPLFILINVWEIKKVEEPELERRLGRIYVEYKKKTPMFFPTLKSVPQRKGTARHG
jgi:protein-S-isoprenylcysteine O-methyltransferase Ste14